MANDTNSLKDVESIINLFRQIIAQAQWDYANGRTTFIYAGGAATVTARRFLFRDDGLEMLVERWGLPIDVEAERNKAIAMLDERERLTRERRLEYLRKRWHSVGSIRRLERLGKVCKFPMDSELHAIKKV